MGQYPFLKKNNEMEKNRNDSSQPWLTCKI
jgi:hypothetical protein